MSPVDVVGLIDALAVRARWPYEVLAGLMNEAPEVLPDVLRAGQRPVCLRCRAHPPLEAGYRRGSDRGSPNQGSALLSKRVRAQMRSPVRVRTYRPTPWRMPVGARR
jgi:hypothetical protein